MHSYEEYNEPIQKLIKIMRDDYPNGFEIRINGFSAELVNNQMVQCYVSEDAMKEYCCMPNLSMEEIMKNINKEKPVD